MLSPAFFSYSVTSKFVEKKENVMGTLLFLSLTLFNVVYSFSNKQRGKLGRATSSYRVFLFFFFFPKIQKQKKMLISIKALRL